MRNRTILLVSGLTAGLAILLLSPSALAGKVYQWKDAKGVTHFSDSPPPDQPGAKDREFKDRAAPPQAAAKVAEDPGCTRARQNLEQLKGGQPVGFDANNDGVPDKEMTAAERAEQLRQTELTLKTRCSQPATKP